MRTLRHAAERLAAAQSTDGRLALELAPLPGVAQVPLMADAPDIRDDAKRLIEHLPAGASWDDLAYEVYVRQAIEQGLADADAGRTVDHEAALARVRTRIRRPA